ncbi:MAG: ferredoxin-type protein NapH [Candidatus Paceibacteria bacterium]|jgi:ferredoxin-type protein NapH
MDSELFNYTFDEEAAGFGAPQSAALPTRMPALARLSLVGVGAALVVLSMQTLGGLLAGTWIGFGIGPGLLTVFASLYFWANQRGTTPGIKHDGVRFDSLFSRGKFGFLAGLLMTALYVMIYWYPQLLGHTDSASPTGLVRVVDAPAQLLTGGQASQWFLYGVLYCLVMVVFSVRVWMKYRHNRYHLARTLSVLFFQIVLAWLLPNLLVRMKQPYIEFNGVWPLKQDYLWPSKVTEMWNGDASLGPVLLIWAGVLSLIATPVLTYFYGKRWYCSWVCGCGGLAETLGDPWRHLSDKSDRAWRIERFSIYGVLAFVLLTTTLLWTNHLTDGAIFGGPAYKLKEWYGFFIGSVFSGVVGVGFYPLLGNRVWCRFGCPQAAILGILQKVFSRFRITTNGGQCISCGNCSTYCEMGIDVRSYAQQGLNIVRASCVGCGVCAAVCPRGVLKLENGATHEGRE